MCLSCGREISLIICQKVQVCSREQHTIRGMEWSVFSIERPVVTAVALPNRLLEIDSQGQKSESGSEILERQPHCTIYRGFITLFYYHNGALSPGEQVFIRQMKLGRWIKPSTSCFLTPASLPQSTLPLGEQKQKQNYKNVQLAEVVSHYSGNARGEQSELKAPKESFSIGCAWRIRHTRKPGASPSMWVVFVDFKLIEFRCAVNSPSPPLFLSANSLRSS